MSNQAEMKAAMNERMNTLGGRTLTQTWETKSGVRLTINAHNDGTLSACPWTANPKGIYDREVIERFMSISQPIEA